jgi:mycothiol synthase
MNQPQDFNETDRITAKELATFGQRKNGTHIKEDGEMFKEVIEQKDAAATKPFNLRPTTMDDLEEAVELFNHCSIHMMGKKEVTVNDVRVEWLLPDFDLRQATRVAIDQEGRLVGYVEVWDIDELPVDIWVWARVHPEYEGQGIGSALMAWAKQRTGRALRRVPEGIRVAMRSGTHNGYGPAVELFKGFGMKPVRHFYTMAIELDEAPPTPQWPEGIEIRRMKGPEEARDVVWAVRDAFQDHWGYVEQPFEKELEHWLHFMKHDEQFDPGLYFLAMAGEEIAGISLCTRQSREDKEMGWVRTLGVRRPWRRQGLGLALLHHSFGELYRLGQARVGLGVDASSLTGATRLYERAGMRPIRQFDTFELELRPGRDIRTQKVKHQSTE